MTENDEIRKKERLKKDLETYRKLEREAQIKESLEVIGNSLLSGLSSVTSLTADALEKAVVEIQESNRTTNLTSADKIKKDLALKKKKQVLKKYKKAEKEVLNRKNKAQSTAFLLTFIICLTAFGMPFMYAGLLGAGASFLTKKFYNPKKKPVGLTGSQLKFSPEYMKIIDEANKDLENIMDIVENGKDSEIQYQASKLYEKSLQILDYLQEHPEKISRSSRFLTYYLDTASNICEKYSELSKRNIVNEDTKKATENAKRAMILLEKAFDNEFMKLMEDDIIDLETDVKVLENSMKWDNYVD